MIGVVGNGEEEEEGCRWELWTLVTAKVVEKAVSLWWTTENETSVPAEVHQTAAALVAVVVETVVEEAAADDKASFSLESDRLMSPVAQ